MTNPVRNRKSAIFADQPKANRISNGMTMVVARYNENLDWLENIPWHYIVYNKGGDLPTWIKYEIKLHHNIGREVYTYLTYIIDNYDALPDYTIFAHGHPFDHSREFIKNINNFDGKDDFFPLSDSVCIDNFEGLRGMGLELEVAESVRRLFLNNIKSFEYPDGAQFIVSKKAILFHTKTTYEKIRTFLIKSESEAENKIADEVIGRRVFSANFPLGKERLFPTKMAFPEIIDSMTNEGYVIGEDLRIFSPYVMEILWETLFDHKHKTIYD